jgi:hypothetical protein
MKMSKSAFKVGDAVSEIPRSVVSGTVVKIGICPVEGERQFLVEWPDTNGDGDPEQRWFNEDQIEAVNG